MTTNSQINTDPQSVNAALFTPSSTDDGAGADLRTCRARVVALEQERDKLREAQVQRLAEQYEDHCQLLCSHCRNGLAIYSHDRSYWHVDAYGDTVPCKAIVLRAQWGESVYNIRSRWIEEGKYDAGGVYEQAALSAAREGG